MLTKLLPWRAFIPALTALLVASTAIAFTGLYVFNVLSTLSNSVGVDDDVVVIFSGTSKLPQTGVIPVNIVRGLEGVDGVNVVSAEVLTPVEVNGYIVFLRGVNFSAFRELSKPKLVLGTWPSSSNDVLVGSRLARYLGIVANDVVVVKGVLTSDVFRLNVSGVFETETPLDDELVASLSLGQKLRDLPPDVITLIRVGVDPRRLSSEGLNRILGIKEVRRNVGGGGYITALPSAILTSLNKSYTVTSVEDFMEVLLERGISISKAFLWGAVLVVAASSTLVIYHSTTWVLRNLEPTTSILRALGFTRVGITCLILTRLVLISIMSGFIGYLLGYLMIYTLTECGLLRILLHTVLVTHSHSVLAVSLMAPSVISAVSLLIKSSTLLNNTPAT